MVVIEPLRGLKHFTSHVQNPLRVNPGLHFCVTLVTLKTRRGAEGPSQLQGAGVPDDVHHPPYASDSLDASASEKPDNCLGPNQQQAGISACVSTPTSSLIVGGRARVL